MDGPEDKTVLVVDDEEDVRCFLADVLEDAGLSVVTAADGNEALARVRERPPDLVSLDLVMPGSSGIRFLHELRRNPTWADIPVVVVTAHAHDDLGGDDFRAIFDGRSLSGPKCYLEKPVTPESYARVVCDSLGVEPGAEPATDDEGRLRAELEALLGDADTGRLKAALEALKGEE